MYETSNLRIDTQKWMCKDNISGGDTAAQNTQGGQYNAETKSSQAQLGEQDHRHTLRYGRLFSPSQTADQAGHSAPIKDGVPQCGCGGLGLGEEGNIQV